MSAILYKLDLPGRRHFPPESILAALVDVTLDQERTGDILGPTVADRSTIPWAAGPGEYGL